MAYRWECPYCRHSQMVTADNSFNDRIAVTAGENRRGKTALSITAVSCLNQMCKEMTFTVGLFAHGGVKFSTIQFGARQEFWPLLPESSAKPQPEYIPAQLRQDYYEACRIADLSPKASATLSRRCLQGMIRLFCGISKKRLIDEINELRDRVNDGDAPRGVTPETVEAIDHVRSIGNIGAHMEADTNLIIDVDPGEAEALLRLVEMLFDEWYVAQRKRAEKLAAVAGIAEAKKNGLSSVAEPKAIPDGTEGSAGAIPVLE
jgi:hypothetical protein